MRIMLVVILGAVGLLFAAAPPAASIVLVDADPLPGGARTGFEDVSPATPTSPFTVALRGAGVEVAAVVEAIGYTHWLYQCAFGDCRVYSWAAGNPFPSGSMKITFTPGVKEAAILIEECATGADALRVNVVGSDGNEAASPGCQEGKWISIKNAPGGTIRELQVWASYGGAFDELTVDPATAIPAELRLSGAQRAGDALTIDFLATHISGGGAPGALLSVLYPDAPVMTVHSPLQNGQSVTHTVHATRPTPHCDGAYLVVGVLRDSAEADIDDNVASVPIFPDPATFAPREDCTTFEDDDCDGFTNCADPDCAAAEGCFIEPADIADGNPPDPAPPALPILFPPAVLLPADPPPEPCKITVAGVRKTFPSYCCQGRPTLASPFYTRWFNDCPPKDPNSKESTPTVGANGIGWTRAGERIEYVLHYENIGASDAHDVEIIDPLDRDLDEATLEIADGGRYDAATRTLTWIDPVVFPKDPRAVHFAVRVRAGAGPGTHVRNVATIVFPDAFPPTRIDTNPAEHVIPVPQHSLAPRLFVASCVAAAAPNTWTVRLANWGLSSAYNARVRAVRAPAGVEIVRGDASGFAHVSDVAPATMASVVPFAATPSTDVVEIVTPDGKDPCPRVAWEISYQDAEGAAHAETTTLAACTLDSDCGGPQSGMVCVAPVCLTAGAADAGVDASSLAPDAGAGLPDAARHDAATSGASPDQSSGCGCTLQARRGADPRVGGLLVALAALLVARRSRRRGRLQ